MTDATAITGPRLTVASRLAAGRAWPIAAVSLVILVIWYLGAIYMNAGMQIDRFEREQTAWNAGDLVRETLAQERPLLPAPHQILIEMKKTIIDKKITSKRSLVFHSWVTLSSTLLGFVGDLVADHPDPRHSADDRRGAGRHRLEGPGAQGCHFHLSVLFPGHHRHGQGLALARPVADGFDANL
jgi:hypothetical protein